MLPIPTELFTLGASFVASSVATLWKQSMEKRQALFEMALAKSDKQQQIYAEARTQGSTGFQLTRRIIAIGVIFSIVICSLYLPYFIKDVPIHIGLPEMTKGFWFFSDPRVVTKWFSFDQGIVIGPLFTHMATAITGFFFGNQVVK
jgi:xanthine/uracil permease